MKSNADNFTLHGEEIKELFNPEELRNAIVLCYRAARVPLINRLGCAAA